VGDVWVTREYGILVTVLRFELDAATDRVEAPPLQVTGGNEAAVA
jgi:hypothetical protein